MSKKDIYFDEPSRLSTAVTSARHKLSLLERRGTMPYTWEYKIAKGNLVAAWAEERDYWDAVMSGE